MSMVDTPKPIGGKRIWKADKRFSPGVLTLGILGGVSQFIAAVIGGLAWGFASGVEDMTGETIGGGFLGLGAEFTAGLVIITGIIASILAFTGAAMNRGTPLAAMWLLWGSVVIGAGSPGPTVIVLIAAVIHTIGVFRASKVETV